MGIFNHIKAIISPPNAQTVAKSIIRNCQESVRTGGAWQGCIDRQHLDTLERECKSRAANTPIPPRALGMALAYMSKIDLPYYAKTLQVLEDIMPTILDIAEKSDRLAGTSSYYYSCFRFLSSQLYKVTDQQANNFRNSIPNIHEYKKIRTCAASWFLLSFACNDPKLYCPFIEESTFVDSVHNYLSDCHSACNNWVKHYYT